MSELSCVSESCSFLGHSEQTRRVGVFSIRSKSKVEIAVGRGSTSEPHPLTVQAAKLRVGVGVGVAVSVAVGVWVEVGVYVVVGVGRRVGLAGAPGVAEAGRIGTTAGVSTIGIAWATPGEAAGEGSVSTGLSGPVNRFTITHTAIRPAMIKRQTTSGVFISKETDF